MILGMYCCGEGRKHLRKEERRERERERERQG